MRCRQPIVTCYSPQNVNTVWRRLSVRAEPSGFCSASMEIGNGGFNLFSALNLSGLSAPHRMGMDRTTSLQPQKGPLAEIEYGFFAKISVLYNQHLVKIGN